MKEIRSSSVVNVMYNCGKKKRKNLQVTHAVLQQKHPA